MKPIRCMGRSTMEVSILQTSTGGPTMSPTDTAFHQKFHTFALEWEEGKLRWYVDGELFQHLGSGMWYSSSAAFPAPFNRRFHLLINLAVGGNWPGPPDGSTTFPAETWSLIM